MKILISAYSCEPGVGSERGVGWNVVYEAAKYNEVWVLTRPDESKEAIEAELARNPMPNLHFVYFTLPIWGGGWRLGSNGAMQIHYYLWQIQAYFVARRLQREIGFDVAHHVTFVKYSSPSFLSFLPIPFVWGPVGGAESAPKPFWKDFSRRAWLYETARNVVRGIGEWDPFVKLTARRSAAVRATTQDTAKQLYKMGAEHVQILPESGIPQAEIEQLGKVPVPSGETIRFISMGRLLHWKGFHLGIRAFAKADLPNAEYWILGDGPEEDTLCQMAKALGVEKKVKFWGRVPRDVVLEKLAQCHVMIHPSLHDSGGWVCMEAMAAGRPVLCLDLGGPGFQVTSETGIKIAAHNPEQAIDDLTVAIAQLADDKALRQKMGAAGRKLVSENYTWEVNGQRLSQLYKTLVSS
ncbi:MAG: glycosyltransferase [Cyanobacteria bacterium P01_D01_bin.1]